jgi:hypothetical protein
MTGRCSLSRRCGCATPTSLDQRRSKGTCLQDDVFNAKVMMTTVFRVYNVDSNLPWDMMPYSIFMKRFTTLQSRVEPRIGSSDDACNGPQLPTCWPGNSKMADIHSSSGRHQPSPSLDRISIGSTSISRSRAVLVTDWIPRLDAALD